MIATGTDSHRQIAELCFAAGKQVFVEKPLAGTLADAQAIVDAVPRSGLVAQAGFRERFNPQDLEAKRAVWVRPAGKCSRGAELAGSSILPFESGLGSQRARYRGTQY